ncbi:MAG TPA: hypothetical protein PKK99_11815 [Bacteroidia bacterium]|nr:hypothetical protein [Bacteroidia bacterium]HNP99735.1 hypothetical protein [Bacteroidia bacterium]
MKKQFTFVLSILLLSVFFINESIASSGWYMAKIRFGNNSKSNCHGFGICTVNAPGDGCLLYTSDGGKTFTLEVSLSEEKLAPEQFAGSNFIVENDFTFPSGFQEFFNLSKPYVLKAGSYKMIKSAKSILVYLN